MSIRRALITGGNRGIGASIKVKLLENEIEVLSPSRKELDLSSDASIDRFLSEFRQPIDILVNNAGVNELGSIVTYTDEGLVSTIQTNLLSVCRLTRGIVPLMKKNSGGRIVNISSIWSVVAKESRLPYSISKAGLNALTRSLAVELAEYGILVNAVAPGYVLTELTAKNNSKPELEVIKQRIPLKRLAHPNEIAEVVSFLVAETNSYITGQVLVVDGGYTCL